MGVFRQFPYSNFHEMNMDEIIKIVKNMLEEWAQYHAEWDAWMNQMNDDWSNYQEVMNEAWQNMQDFINNYFDNLDVQNEINNKITSMVNSGEFGAIVEPYIPPRVTAWLTENITQPVGVVIDTSLSVAGACADAKATGDAINTVKGDLDFVYNEMEKSSNNIFPHISTAWKQGTPSDTLSTRISTKDYIDLRNGSARLYLKFDGAPKVNVLFDFYRIEDDVMTLVSTTGYYNADTDFGVHYYNLEYTKITLKRPDGTDIKPSDVPSLTDNVTLYLADGSTEADYDTPIKLRVMQFNIGKFNYGNPGGLVYHVDEKIANYKRYLSDIQPDICCMQEYPMTGFTGYIGTIDANGLYPPDETIFDQLFSFKGAKHFGVTTKDRVGFSSSVGVSIDEEDVTYRTKGVVNTYKIHGKRVGLITGYFDVFAPEEKRLSQLNDCINRMSEFDYAIICVDTNALSKAELDTMVSTAETAGYTCANGAYWGYMDTLHSESLYPSPDNIFIKGFKVINSYSADTYDTLSSDHYPIYCDIVMV